MVPELEYDGFVLGESSAIITFLAKEFNLAGKDNREEARCAMIASLASDLLSKGRPVRYEQVYHNTKEAECTAMPELYKAKSNNESIG